MNQLFRVPFEAWPAEPAPREAGVAFAVSAWSAWAPGRETRAAWRAWAGAPADPDNDGHTRAAVPMMIRRRATPLGQKVLAAALDCGPVVANARYVFASRHGEFSRMPAILGALARDELPSPAEFSMAVHHALTGLLSIGTGNTRGHTALAAGLDSFGFGMMEAAACLAERPDEPVLLLHGDEPLTGEYAVFGGGDVGLPLVIALALESVAGDNEGIFFRAESRSRAGAMLDEAAPHAFAPLDFLRFLISGTPRAASEGVAMTWTWCRGD